MSGLAKITASNDVMTCVANDNLSSHFGLVIRFGLGCIKKKRKKVELFLFAIYFPTKKIINLALKSFYENLGSRTSQ